MDKKIIIAIDDSINAIQAVHYAAQMATVIPELGFVLLHVQPALSQYLTQEAPRKSEARLALEKVIQKNEANAHELLVKASQRMVRKGVNESRIERLTIPRDTGVANDILVLAKAKSYDAILVGRRGSSYLREWVMGSVTANLVEHSKAIPIWVVNGEVNTNKVLLAADGSTASLRALDHMAFMLSAMTDQKIHVLHVRPRFQDYCEIELEAETERNAGEFFLNEDRKCMDDFFPQALAVLERNGVDRNRLELETMDGSLSVPRAITQYARDNDFGTIVMGRRGRSKNLFTGSVSRSLMNKTGDTTLWITP